MMPNRLAVVALLLLLTACQQAPVHDEASSRSRISEGSQFVLHQVLSVPAGHARVFLQHGRVVAKVKLERYQPHCNFEVRSVSEGESTIQPDTFVVTALMEDEVEVVKGESWRRTAALLFSRHDTDTPLLSRFVRHTLHSSRQPEVMRLTCHGGFDEPWRVKAPSVSEIRQSLGALVTLELQRAI